MALPQTGILALGTSSHAYLEFDHVDGVDAGRRSSPGSRHCGAATVSGVNLVVGFRPELWAGHSPSAAPSS